MRIEILVILMLLLTGCSSSHVDISGERISVEVPRTVAEKQRGLMFREELCDSCGMLFVYDLDYRMTFWMKNTLIPLDMIFINSELEIVDIIHAVPCEAEPCPYYRPKDNARYVLEVNGNKYDESLIGENVKISLE